MGTGRDGSDGDDDDAGDRPRGPLVPPFAWVSALRRRTSLARAVAVVTGLSVLVRLVGLGARTAHWDEARVGHWILHYNEFGSFAYRHIIHGPLIQHVNHYLFPVFGPTDFAMRLPVAVVGGALPATAYLFREHLRDEEVVALALFLGGNSVLVYYSRFMRSDLLVATFMFAGFGLLVRFYDRRRPRYLYGLVALAALGIAAKENAIVYVLTWIGAVGLLADTALYRPREHRTGIEAVRASRVGSGLGVLLGVILVPVDGLDALRERVDRPRALARRFSACAAHFVALGVLFLAIVVFLFAPRGAGLEGLRFQPAPASAGALGLWEAVGRPAQFPGFVVDTLSYTVEEYANWLGASSSPGCNKDNVVDGYICFLGRFLRVILFNAAVLGIFAVLGFVHERYARPDSRGLVVATGYIGLVSVVGYPLGTDIFGAWVVVHALVVMAIPAAVGVGLVYRWGRNAAVERDRIGSVVAAALLVLLALQVGFVTAEAAYVDQTSDGNHLVQFAQPADDMGEAIRTIDGVAPRHSDGADVVLFNGSSALNSEAIVREPGGQPFNHFRPTCSNWPNALPLNWYLVRSGANVSCERQPTALARGDDDQPPVIVTLRSDASVPRARLNRTYTAETYSLRVRGNEVTVWTHEDWTGDGSSPSAGG
ncbi:MAG: flippase activity-associated protein Agl23 [Salinirussus sp.]